MISENIPSLISKSLIKDRFLAWTSWRVVRHSRIAWRMALEIQKDIQYIWVESALKR